MDVLFKNINGNINIIVNENLSFDSFLYSLKNRLEKLYIKDDLLQSCVILDIHNLSLNAKNILQIFDVFSLYENIFLKKIIYKHNTNKNIILHEGNIRSGEIKLFSNNTLLIGNINIGAKVIVNGNLYVIGKTSGFIEFKNVHNKLISSNIENAHIKICNYEKQIEQLQENSLVRIEDEKMIIEKFMDRREKIYGKSNCCYIG